MVSSKGYVNMVLSKKAKLEAELKELRKKWLEAGLVRRKEIEIKAKILKMRIKAMKAGREESLYEIAEAIFGVK